MHTCELPNWGLRNGCASLATAPGIKEKKRNVSVLLINLSSSPILPVRSRVVKYQKTQQNERLASLEQWRCFLIHFSAHGDSFQSDLHSGFYHSIEEQTETTLRNSRLFNSGKAEQLENLSRCVFLNYSFAVSCYKCFCHKPHQGLLEADHFAELESNRAHNSIRAFLWPGAHRNNTK